MNYLAQIILSELIFTSSKSTMETLVKKYEISSKLTITTSERRQSIRSGDFIANFKHISYLFSKSQWLTLNR